MTHSNILLTSYRALCHAHRHEMLAPSHSHGENVRKINLNVSRLWQFCRKLSNTLIVSVRRSKVDIQGMVCGYLVNTGKYFDIFLERW